MSIKRIAVFNCEDLNLSNSYSFECIIKADDGALVAMIDSSQTGHNIMRSTDNGKTWQKIVDGTFKVLKNFNGTLVVGGYGGIQYSEDNGLTWTLASKGGDYKDLEIINGVIVACSGNDSNGKKGIKWSADGKTWNDSNISSGGYNSFEKIKETLIVYSADGGVKWSTDGKTWTESNLATTAYSEPAVYGTIGKAANGTTFVTQFSYGSSFGMYYSADGKTWTDTNNDSSNRYLIEANNGRLISCDAYIKYSDDGGQTWSDTDAPGGSYRRPIKTGNGTLVVYNNYDTGRGIKYSEDNGNTWQDSNYTGYSGSSFYNLNNVLITQGSSSILYSIDNGKTWANDSSIGISLNACFIDDKEAFISSYIGKGKSICRLTVKTGFSGTEGVTLGFKVAQELVSRIKNLKERITALENKN